MILKCNCDHKYQDKKYGYQMRVCNQRQAKGIPSNIYRCTVCKREVTK